MATREQILAAAQDLLDAGGAEAVSTRAVSAAAGVQAPTIYRLFGDKRGLLEALATRGLEAYVAEKARREPGDDPVRELRAGWDLHVGFGLANPALYTIMYAETTPSPAALAGFELLAGLIARIARAGRLRVAEERAAHLVHSAGRGTTLTLIGMPEPDLGLSELAREAVIAAITTDAVPPADARPATAAAVTLRAALPDVDALTDGERAVLAEWLDRIAGR